MEEYLAGDQAWAAPAWCLSHIRILFLPRLLKKQVVEPEAMKKIEEIENASQRINHALKEFSAAQVYETTDSPVGNLVELAPFKSDK